MSSCLKSSPPARHHQPPASTADIPKQRRQYRVDPLENRTSRMRRFELPFESSAVLILMAWSWIVSRWNAWTDILYAIANCKCTIHCNSSPTSRSPVNDRKVELRMKCYYSSEFADLRANFSIPNSDIIVNLFAYHSHAKLSRILSTKGWNVREQESPVVPCTGAPIANTLSNH